MRSGVQAARVALAGASGCAWTVELVQRLTGNYLQAAAEREYVIGHPVRRAVSVRKYLRLQHAVLSEVLIGALPSRPALRPHGQGSISTDATRHAALSGNRLYVRDLCSGRLEHVWELPQLSARERPSTDWRWDGGCGHLVLPYGGGWTLPELLADTDTSAAGLLFLELATGKPVVAHFQDAGGQDWLACHCCPSRSLVLVEHRAEGRSHSVLLEVFSCQGVLLHSIGKRTACMLAKLAPDGSKVALILRPSSVAVWDLASGASVHLEGAATEMPPVWVTPDSGQLALLSCSEGVAVTIAGLQVPLHSTVLAPREAFDQHVCVGWGSRMVLRTGDFDSPRLLLYRVQHGQLSLQQTVTAGPRVFASGRLDLSADGELAAILTETLDPSSGQLLGQHLAVLHLATGCLREYPLLQPQLSDALPHIALRLHWTPDSAAVLVSSPDGSCCELFSFASGL